MNDWKFVEEFEESVADYAGAKYGVSTDSCTHAIFISLLWEIQQTGIKKVCCPTQTYISVPQTIRHLGLDILYIDEMWDGYYKIHNTSVVDSACLFTSEMYQKNTLWCVSFHHRKTLSTIRGGMILNDNLEFTEWAKKMVYDGRDRNKYMKDDFPTLCGYHYYMTPESAMIGLQNFKTLKKDNLPTSNYSQYKNITHI
jgi:dTDP-4-amino-4,6-dideoxygalactose transaminase